MTITANGIETVQSYSGVSSAGLTYAIGGSLQANCVLVLAVGFVSPTSAVRSITSITDSAGNTWQLYSSQSSGSGWDTTNTVNGVQKGFTQELWYTKGATCNTSITITITHDNTIDTAVAALLPKFLGCDATNPWDANASLPRKLKATTLTAETITGISTTNTNILPIWALSVWGTDLGLQNVQFNGVGRFYQSSAQKNNSEFTKTQIAGGVNTGAAPQPAVTGPYSSVTYAAVGQNAHNFYIMAAALTSDVGPPPPSRSFGVVVS